MSHRQMLLPLITALLTAGCGADPTTEDLAAYQAAMIPVVTANTALAVEFRYLTLAIRGRQVNPDDVATKLEKNLIPEARDLVKQAAAVSPKTPKLAEGHAELIAAWTLRADAYETVRTGWTKGDLAVIDAATQDHLIAHRQAERSFRKINAVLGTQQLSLDPYPDAQR